MPLLSALLVTLASTLLWSASCRATPPTIPLSAEPLAASCTASSSQRSAASGTPLLLPASPTAALFQASFDTADGSGHFDLYPFSVDGAQAAAGLPLWDAGSLLSGGAGQPPRPLPAARQLYTLRSDASGLTIPFLWPALTDAQRALLDMAPFTSHRQADGLGAQRLAFLRGDRGEEGAPFRRRTSVLGDSVHATPVYVGAASAVVEGDGYAAFYARSLRRRAAVYLGANDGMLHAFDAADGSEIFAYIPALLMAALNQLTSPAYVHRAYVDGPASAAEARLNGAWKTVLVAGLGGGAQGVFALDVSDPQQFATGGGALWEFGDADDADIGNVVGLPQIARFDVDTDGGGARYFAVVPGGLNSYAADGHRNAAANGALFLLALDKARGAPWQLNVNYYRLLTPLSDAALPNGLGAPALVAGVDGVVRYAYAGDLQGNLWRFDFSGRPPWRVGPGAGPAPLFVARDAGGVRQPITQQPRVVYASGGGYPATSECAEFYRGTPTQKP
ncbi:PilC/PilY family type IV pilus protein [Rugamonas sp.]|uniref:pilus assembly protein n=1 Tax=Rugamonas sp. TaxID=1926287 RepID=UPI0025D5740A|nr:PilC/PilY family type IV pilus protein [Rugamonas sp.]